MKAIRITDLTYRYPGREENALERLDLTAEYGQLILIRGPSGSGKSSLCRLINGLIPSYFGGEISGSAQTDGLDAITTPVAEMSTHAGLIFQDPEDQIIMSTVEAELAFGLENLRLEPEEIGRRIDWALQRLGIKHLIRRKTDELSAGEKQKVALASVLAMKPRILVLDEPTSQLDAQSKNSLYSVLKSLHREGYTIIIVEHDADEAEKMADRIIDLGQTPPPPPLPPQPKIRTGKVLLKVDDLTAAYGGRKILERLSFTVSQGECLAVTGPNGSGKTTLLKHINGLMKPQSGRVSVCGRDTRAETIGSLAGTVAYLPQNPSDMLFCESAEDELRFTLKHLKRDGDVEGILRRFGLWELRASYPRDLSVGQKQRLALAAVLIADPALIVLDEPTRGIDAAGRRALVSHIRQLLSAGKAAVIATHDRRLVEEAATEELTLGGRR